LINIPGRAFPVTTYFLEDAYELTKFKIDAKSECIYKPDGKDKDKDPQAKKKAEMERTQRLQTFRRTLNTKYTEQTIRNLEIVDESMINKDLIVSLVANILRNICYRHKSRLFKSFTPPLLFIIRRTKQGFHDTSPWCKKDSRVY